jgi:hypothetical protein
VSEGDPTDYALAAIASILDQPEVHREPVRPAVDERLVIPPPLPAFAETHAPVQPLAPAEIRAPVKIHAPIEAHGYARVGPGPIAAIRFKWSVRADNGEYYVDETIGENSTPVVSGPMSRDAAVQMVHDREAEAHRRFEQLKSEMSGRGAAANLMRKDSGEA